MIRKGKSISKKVIGCGIFLILSLVMFIGIVASLLNTNIGSYGSGEIPEAVKQWEPQITKELEKYGRAEHINLLLAIVARESGGTSSLDIMQASESLGYPPNTITDPLYSIEVGVAYFDEVMTEAENADVDIDTAIQAYNMGCPVTRSARSSCPPSTASCARTSSSRASSPSWSPGRSPTMTDLTPVTLDRVIDTMKSFDVELEALGEDGVAAVANLNDTAMTFAVLGSSLIVRGDVVTEEIGRAHV